MQYHLELHVSVNQELYLKAMMGLIARQTFKPEDVAKFVCPTVNSAQILKSYNLCDGSRTQAEIVKETGVDNSNFAKKVKKWEFDGVMLRIERGNDECPLHVFPISEKLLPKNKSKS